MKKKLFLLSSCIILLIIGTGVYFNVYADVNIDLFKNQKFLIDSSANIFKNKNNTVLITVNGEKIYNETVDFMLDCKKITEEDLKEHGQEVVIETTKQDVIDDLIQQAVILQEAKKMRLESDYSMAYKYAKENVSSIKNSNDQSAINFYNKYLEKLNISEKEYIKILANIFQNDATKKKFHDNYLHDENKTEYDYTNYVKSLINNSDIVYLKNY